MQQYFKAIFAAAFAGLGATQTAYVAGGGHINFVSSLTIVVATLSALAVVFGVPNKVKEEA